VPYSVHFAAEIDAPADLLSRALEVLLEIAASMESISPTSAFWSEAHSANAELTLGGVAVRVPHPPSRSANSRRWGAAAQSASSIFMSAAGI